MGSNQKQRCGPPKTGRRLAHNIVARKGERVCKTRFSLVLRVVFWEFVRASDAPDLLNGFDEGILKSSEPSRKVRGSQRIESYRRECPIEGADSPTSVPQKWLDPGFEGFKAVSRDWSHDFGLGAGTSCS